MEIGIDELLRRVIEHSGSDLHLKVGAPPAVRVDNQLVRLDGLATLRPVDTEGYSEALFTERAQNEFQARGEADFAYGRPDVGRFRVAAFRQRGSVSLVLHRVVAGSPTFEELGLPAIIRRLVEDESGGLVLVTGPSGSGKTTTISALVNWVNEHRAASIVTIEDPIEVLHPDKRAVVAQREVGVDTADFAQAVRAAMRQDADVIVISEIDDHDTARAAIAAAETGHRVISSMRTTDPNDTIRRLVGYFPPTEQPAARSQLAALVQGIISQRLLEPIDGTGQILAAEILTSNERIREWISSGSGNLEDIIKESEFFGMQTFDQAILKLVLTQRVAVPTALPHVRNGHDLRARAIEAGVAG